MEKVKKWRKKMLVSDVMRCTLMTVSETQSVFSLVNWYNNLTNNSRIAYVVDDHRRLLGVVTIYDLIGALSTPWIGDLDNNSTLESDNKSIDDHLDEMKKVPIKSIMRVNYQWVSPEEKLSVVIQKIIENRHTAVPVLDAEKNLVGEISRRIVLNVLGRSSQPEHQNYQRPLEMPLFNFQGMIA